MDFKKNDMTKTEFVKVRLTDAEKRGFKRAAEIAGISLSAWMRERLRRSARRELEDVGEQAPFIRFSEGEN